MKKFISIIAAAACAVTLVSFTACGDETEPETPSDVVTEEEWVAAFEMENFANVTAERSFSYEYSYLTNSVGSFTDVYYDPDQYIKETQKVSATSTAKVDTEYSESEYTSNNRTYTYENYDGYLGMNSEWSVEGNANYNHTDVDVLKEALGENFTDDDYTSWEYDSQRLDNDYNYAYSANKTYKDYILYITEEDAYFSDYYLAEQRTEDGATGDWGYSSSSSGGYPDLIFETRVGYLDATGGSVPFSSTTWGDAYFLGDEVIYENSVYDEESGAYVHTYHRDNELGQEELDAWTNSGVEWTLEGGATTKYYVKINDGHVSSIKMQYTYTYYLTVTNDIGTYYKNYEVTSVAEYKFYDYGTTVVEVPEDINSALAALKESN